MSKVIIKNLTGNPVTLPPPLAGVLDGGGATIVDFPQGADALAAILGPACGGPFVVSFVDAPNAEPLGPITFETSADFVATGFSFNVNPVDFNAVRLINVSNPTDAQDVATKDYVDNTAGGTGTVTSVAVGTGLTTDVGMGGDPITTSGTISISQVPLANTADELAKSGTASATSGAVVIDPADGSAQTLAMSAAVTGCSFSTTNLVGPPALTASTAVLISNPTGGALDFTGTADSWIGAVPVWPVSVAGANAAKYLLVFTNFGSTVVGSWQALA